MDSQEAALNAMLQQGGWVVTASDRAGRAAAAAYHGARLAEGLKAWPAPAILDWSTFVRSAWEARTRDGRLVLSPVQEEALWAELIAGSGTAAGLLEGPRHRLAAQAREAHGRLCGFAPQLLRNSARSGWQHDAAAFSAWLTAFDRLCGERKLISSSRLALELIPLLDAEGAERPPLLLVGFDRIQPAQRAVLNAWGAWRQAAPGDRARETHFHSAADTESELAACAAWCSRRLAAQPGARLLVVTQEIATRRGAMERAFLEQVGAGDSLPFEFSLGVPLGGVMLARSGWLVLRWLWEPIEEVELDWLLSTGKAAGSAQEALALQGWMRALRQGGLERTRWPLESFLMQAAGRAALPSAWAARMRQARNRLSAEQRRTQSPLEWAALAPHLLEMAGWPGYRTLASAEFEALRRWEQALDQCASLGFDGRRVAWQEFMKTLSRTLGETLFAPESHHAPIQIAGPAESAGLTADGIWMLGASEEAWPARGGTNPLLPPEVQRAAQMPHGSPQIDWEMASATTARLMDSAAEVHFSYARQMGDAESRPSRLAIAMAGEPEPIAAPAGQSAPLTVEVEDASTVAFSPGTAGGGASVLTNQSQCPFKAFATTRLGAQGWQPAEAGLTARQRGLLLHAVLHRIWAGPPDGIRTLEDLQKLEDRPAFVAGHVRRVLGAKMPAGAREQMPRRYLALEEPRLTGLVTEWLEYEAARWPFEVAGTEAKKSATPAGLTLALRLDRIDRLKDGSLLVIDYKTGAVTPRDWDLPRPADVQLPLYAGFALGDGAELGGLVFASIRAGRSKFAGRVGDAKGAIRPDLGGTTDLVKNPLTAERLIDWRDAIEQLARDFLAGKAEVDPRDFPHTCEGCGLDTLCRIREQPGAIGDDDAEPESDGEFEEGGDA